MPSPLLPHDLLLHIIDRFVQNSTDAITISHVDTSFRAAALSLSALWSSIHIDLSKSSTLSMANVFYERVIARDSKVSLSVHVELRPTEKPRPRHSQIIAFIKACAPRMYSFEATYGGGAIVVWYLASGIHNLLDTELPSSPSAARRCPELAHLPPTTFPDTPSLDVVFSSSGYSGPAIPIRLSPFIRPLNLPGPQLRPRSPTAK